MSPILHTINNATLELLAEKAAFWREEKTLLIADLHLGKISHFRRSGIPVPEDSSRSNHERLINLLLDKNPEKVLFLGDLFHSHYNHDWEVLGQIIYSFPQIQFTLVEGNHDILSQRHYIKNKIQVIKNPMTMGAFIFSHIPLEEPGEGFNLAGHIHPGVRLRGMGRQQVTLPCFYFGEGQGLLPAFGAFTGLGLIHPKNTDAVYVITENEVIPVGNRS